MSTSDNNTKKNRKEKGEKNNCHTETKVKSRAWRKKQFVSTGIVKGFMVQGPLYYLLLMFSMYQALC